LISNSFAIFNDLKTLKSQTFGSELTEGNRQNGCKSNGVAGSTGQHCLTDGRAKYFFSIKNPNSSKKSIKNVFGDHEINILY
jgi:hypothetical protein